MGSAIGEVLPFALGVAISPIPLVAVIVMLFTRRATANGLAFLAGWVGGLSVLAAVVYVVARARHVATSSTASDSASTVKIVLGLGLVIAGLRRWRRRPRADGADPAPRWMTTIDGFTAVRAAGLGVLLGAVNPKNLVLTFGAASGLAQIDASTGDAIAGLVAFVVVASSTTAAAVTYRLVGGERSRAQLEDAKQWLTEHNDAVMSVLLIVIGGVLAAKGLPAL
jgi:hypothetical protein